MADLTKLICTCTLEHYQVFFWKFCTFINFRHWHKHFWRFWGIISAALSELLYTFPENKNDIESLIGVTYIYWKISKLRTKFLQPSDKKHPEVQPKLFFSFSNGISATKLDFSSKVSNPSIVFRLWAKQMQTVEENLKRCQNSLPHVHRNNLRKINFLKTFLYLLRLSANSFWPLGCRKIGGFVKTALSVSNEAFWGKLIFEKLCTFSPFPDNVPKCFEILADIFRQICQNCILCFHRNSFREIVS